jgi:hypothetical protein
MRDRRSLPRSIALTSALLLAAACGSSSPGGSGSGGTGGSAATGRGGSTSGGAGSSGGGVTGTGGSATGAGGSATGAGGSATGTGGSATGTGGSTTGGAGTTGAGGTGGGKLPIGSAQCSDGMDNDGDGKVDYNDPECVGPLDNDEGTFATGIPGDNMDACKQDCFFDGNSGAGDDGCDWQLKCDPRSTNSRCPYDQQYAESHMSECSLSASQSDKCINFCRRLVPNGCDCFGCCTVPGAPTPIQLAATCTAADFNNPAKCPACTQVTQCNNPCERCELCIGKTTLPADCTPDGGTDAGTTIPDCGSDFVACGPGTGRDPSQCPSGTGCLTGCCLPIVE